MHFPIIQLCDTRKKSREDRITEFSFYDDKTVEYFTDYVGDTYTDKKRAEYLREDYLKKLFEGIADVDDTGKITFFSEEKIRETLRQEYKAVLDKLQENLQEGHLRGYNFRSAGEYFRDDETMFYYESCTQSSGAFMEDTVYFAGKTLYVGAIIDAHI